ncbi:NADPH2:quinone reductase [Colletotrichum higginsianum]|nr:NADPH2:quinone reductase [Colletotrichum higginsianum]
MSSADQPVASATMRAIGIPDGKYGPIDNLESRQVPCLGSPPGRWIKVAVKAVSVNPIDIKIRKGTYDDTPNYYNVVRGINPGLNQFHAMGGDVAGVVTELGPDATLLKVGDEIYGVGSAVRWGTYAEEAIIDETKAAIKPKSLDWTQSAAMPLTYNTAYESIVERLEVKKGEKAGIVIINGGGGVGAVAIQIARHVLGLPVVIATCSRPETTEFARSMGATHTVNHQEDIVSQIAELNLPKDIPLRYAYITSRTEQYINPLAEVLAPFGKVCSIVQARFDMYGSKFMSKSLTFSWCWLGTEPFYRHYTALSSTGGWSYPEMHHEWLTQLATMIDEGVVKPHLTRRAKLTLEGIKEAHRLIESGTAVGKMALGVDDEGEGQPFS